MFRGQSRHTIDQKGRLSLPARFRDALESDGGELRLIMTSAPYEPCLHLYPLKVWEDYERKISDLPTFDPTAVLLRRLYVSPAEDVEVDKTGRIRVPQELREKAGLKSEALWAGMGRSAELWSVSNWQEAISMTEQQVTDFRRAVQELIRV